MEALAGQKKNDDSGEKKEKKDASLNSLERGFGAFFGAAYCRYRLYPASSGIGKTGPGRERRPTT
jgi:hypothetical protein